MASAPIPINTAHIASHIPITLFFLFRWKDIFSRYKNSQTNNKQSDIVHPNTILVFCQFIA